MSNYLHKYKEVGLGVFAGLMIIAAFLALISYLNFNFPTDNPLILFAVEHHGWIMFAGMVVAVLFGYFWSLVLYKEIEKEEKKTQNVLDIVNVFLGEDEKMIIKFLLDSNGKTTQSEITRLNGMNKVKAYRSLQKLQKKGIVLIRPHGKVRYIMLKEELKGIL